MSKPNVLVILTDQMRCPPAYESEELAGWRAEAMPGVERLRRGGVSFAHHYPMAIACAPSRASLLTGQYPSLHGVAQTDGFKGPGEVSWLAPDASHAHLDADDGDGYLLSIDDDGVPIEANVDRHLEADLLDDFGFSEWVGPEPHGLGRHNTGTVKDPFTAAETIELLGRLAEGEDEAPWLTVCSFLNPHDDSLFGLIGLVQGRRYHPSQVPHVAQAPFYYQLQATVDEQVGRVLDALATSPDAEDRIVVFSSDHGDMQGAHGGMHEKWHVAYEEALHVPLIIAGPVTEPEPDEFELSDLTADPYEERNLAHPAYADEASRELEGRMLDLLVGELERKRLMPSSGEVPGYRPPAVRGLRHG